MKKDEGETDADRIIRLEKELSEERDTNAALRVALEKLLWAMRARNDGPPPNIQIPPKKTH